MLKPIEVKVLDINSDYLGVPVEDLMENAGDELAEAVISEGGRGKNVLIFCGPGNNGGDGFTAAHHLQKKANVRVVLMKPPSQINTALARRRYEVISDLAKTIGGADEIVVDIAWADIIVDAMLGVGVKGDLREPYETVVHLINSSEKKVISADVPTGLGNSEAVKPNLTVTFHDVKEGMSKKNSGKIVVADIGIPKEAVTGTGPGLFQYYPLNANTSHKGDNGHLLVIGGGPYTGAPALSALAAYRAGVDLVTVASPKWAAGVIAGYSPSIIATGLDCETLGPSQIEELLNLAKRATTVLIGPGIGRDPETGKLLAKLIPRLEVPVVLDADALTLLEGKARTLRKVQSIITPHNREFKTLFGDAVKRGKRENMVIQGAKETQGVVLLKGHTDIIGDADGRTLENKTGHGAMTVGGTGDVLAGLVAGLAAKGVDLFNAASLGAFVNGYAGQLAFNGKSYGLMPMDVVEAIPQVLKKFL